MRTKTNSGSVVLKAAAIVLGACLTIIGMTSASGDLVTILKLAGAEGGFVSFAKTLDKLPPWYNTALALAGLLLIGGILNGVESRGRNHSALNSKLIRRPVQRMFLLFLAPTFAAFCIGFLYPFVKGIFLSFCRFKTTSKWTWVGFDNYINAFQDSTFVHAFWYTALFALVSLLLINVLSFAVAYALTRGIKGTNIFRTVFFMPNLIGGIILGYIWMLLLNGVLAHWQRSLTYDQKYGFWGLVILVCWQQIGYMMIIYIAGMQSLPTDVLEAASVDGASGTQTMFRIIIPLMMPSITVCSFLTVTNGFKLYDQNLALTNGAPSRLSEGLALNITNTFYARTGFEGVGQAKAVLFFILVAVVALLQNKLTTSKEVTA